MTNVVDIAFLMWLAAVIAFVAAAQLIGREVDFWLFRRRLAKEARKIAVTPVRCVSGELRPQCARME